MSGVQKIKFTQRLLDSLSPVPPGQPAPIKYQDTALPGLWLHVGRKDKSFFAVRNLQRGGKWQMVRVLVGKYPEMAIDTARAEAALVLGRMGKGEDPTRSPLGNTDVRNILVSEAFARYTESRLKSGKMRESTAQAMGYHAKKYLEPLLLRPVASLTPSDIINARRAVKAKTAGDGAFRYLRAVLTYIDNVAYDTTGEPLWPRNPVRALATERMWSRPAAKSRALSPEEIGKVIQVVRDRSEKASSVGMLEQMTTPDYVLFLLFTGCRKSEASGLQWKDVDAEKGKVTFRNTKNGEDRTIPIPAFLTSILSRRKNLSGTEKWVFPGTGESGHLEDAKRFLAGLAKTLGIEHFSAHDLRRTFITQGKQHMPGYHTEHIVGHRLGTVTGRHYDRPGLEDLRRSVETLAAKMLSYTD